MIFNVHFKAIDDVYITSDCNMQDVYKWCLKMMVLVSDHVIMNEISTGLIHVG